MEATSDGTVPSPSAVHCPRRVSILVVSSGSLPVGQRWPPSSAVSSDDPLPMGEPREAIGLSQLRCASRLRAGQPLHLAVVAPWYDSPLTRDISPASHSSTGAANEAETTHGMRPRDVCWVLCADG